jgi:two-component system chemotaxis sensor kinase CheA
MDAEAEILQEFLVESAEGLDRLDQDLVALETEPGDRARLGAIFRTIHSIKGTCGFLGLPRLEALAHAGENLLSLLRDGAMSLTAEIATALLTMVDAIRRVLAEIEATGAEGESDHADIIATLHALAHPGAAGATAKGGAEAHAPAATSTGEATNAAAPAEPTRAPTPTPAARKTLSPRRVGEILVERGVTSREAIEEVIAAKAAEERIGEALVRAGQATPQAVLEALNEQANASKAAAAARETKAPARKMTARPAAPAAAPTPAPTPAAAAPAAAGPASTAKPSSGGDGHDGEHAKAAVAETSIRVDINLLDRLMNLVGELVLTRNQILQYGANLADAAFSATSQRLDLLTTELQEGVMKTRMQPIGQVWNKFPRVVRDLAHSCGKQVALEMEGNDTELDRSIIEAIKDPLTHMVRNSIDHGLEFPGVRRARGKSPQGRLKMRAFHEGGQVNIEVEDDGAGIDAVAVREKAISRGLLTPEKALRMTDRELCGLIFMPGFSTAKQVTAVSGRGVGMDVVKTNIERIGGTIDVHSRVGEGTTIKIKIPLTLAIIPALTIASAGERFAIPQVSLLELVRVDEAYGEHVVEMIHGAPVFRLRGNLLPLVHLGATLRLATAPWDRDRTEKLSFHIVVLQADNRQFGLVVDAVHDTEEIVVKPLGKELKGLNAYAGATIMGDGKVALILDVMGIAQRAGILAEQHENKDAMREDLPTLAAEGADDRQSILLVQTPGHTRVAIPLAMVARLEEFPRKAIERAGRRSVVQYRGRILPLVDVSSMLESDLGRAEHEGPIQVVVYTENGRSVGLVVERILDIVEDRIVNALADSGGALHGAAVVQGKVTELLDVHGVIRGVDPSFFDTAAAS